MSKEKLMSLTKYSNDLKNRLSGTVPEKHKNRVRQYHEYINHELKIVNTKIDFLKMNTVPDKK